MHNFFVETTTGFFVSRIKEAEDGGRPLSICVAVRVDAGRVVWGGDGVGVWADDWMEPGVLKSHMSGYGACTVYVHLHMIISLSLYMIIYASSHIHTIMYI